MSNLSVAQVRAILKACSEANVTLLKWGDLSVEFGQKSPLTGSVHALPPTAVKEIAAIQETEAEKALVHDEIELREQQLAMAILEDPGLAEELLTRGELSDDGQAEEDEA